MNILKYIPYKHIFIDKKKINNTNIYNIFYKETFSEMLINILKSRNIMVYNLDIENELCYLDNSLEEYLEEYLEEGINNITIVVINIS